jgi:hypothetical protein
VISWLQQQYSCRCLLEWLYPMEPTHLSKFFPAFRKANLLWPNI